MFYRPASVDRNHHRQAVWQTVCKHSGWGTATDAGVQPVPHTGKATQVCVEDILGDVKMINFVFLSGNKTGADLGRGSGPPSPHFIDNFGNILGEKHFKKIINNIF